MSNVTPLNDRVRMVNDRDPVPEVVAALETALAEAKSGSMRAVAVIGAHIEGEGHMRSVRTERSLNWHLTELMAGAACVHDDMVREMRRVMDWDDAE